MISLDRMIKSIAQRFGQQAAVSWTKAVLGHQARLNEQALRTALSSGKVERVAAVVRPLTLQQNMQRSLIDPLRRAAQASGAAGAAELTRSGVRVAFNAVHPNVVLFARRQAAAQVVGVPAETRAVIGEVIAMGAERGLTVAQQAKAIREVVGLPPAWAEAPEALAEEIRAGQTAAALGRKLPYRLKQQIGKRIADGTVTDEFVDQAMSTYAESLVNYRALSIAHTESLRAANHGVVEGWAQAVDSGDLPPTARKFWLVTPDDRLSEAHATIPGMNPDGREMDESFETTEGPYLYPPSRPNCRCSVGLVLNPGGGSVDGTDTGAPDGEDVIDEG